MIASIVILAAVVAIVVYGTLKTRKRTQTPEPTVPGSYTGPANPPTEIK